VSSSRLSPQEPQQRIALFAQLAEPLPTPTGILYRHEKLSMEHERTDEAYCLAYRVTLEGGKRRLMLASLRYLDTFVKDFHAAYRRRS
jgi:hypothetical protein